MSRMKAVALRLPSVRRVLAVMAALSFMLTGGVMAAQQASAVPALSSGWIQPLDSMSGLSAGFLANDCGYPGYGGYVANSDEYHIANDYGRSAGTAVYSIGAGVVVAKQGGWPGSAVFVRHTAPDGTQFLAVYGHINSGLAVNNTVAAGQQIGTVFDNHLHFGIREATVPATTNNGNMPCSSWPNSNGYRDPLPFLAAHPITSPPPPPPPDQDGDGTPDSADVMPNVPGSALNRGVPVGSSRLSGDFNGDGNQDVAAFYDYGGGMTRLWVFHGTGTGFNAPVMQWNSGPNSWNWNHIKPVVGDFNGDGITDIAAFYHYGGGDTRLWVFTATASGFNAPVMQWNSGPNSWNWENISQLSGDFNGDGITDIAVFYDYGGGDTRLWLFQSSGTGFSPPTLKWASGSGNWNWPNTKPIAGDFNGDGKTDVAALYNYGGGMTRLWVFTATASGFNAPVMQWNSGPNSWNWENISQLSGDFNGDGNQDVAAFYNYGGGMTRLWVFPSNGSIVGAPVKWWESSPGGWNWPNTKPIAGDFNGDGKTDVAALYNYGGGDTRLWQFVSSGSGFNAPVMQWNSGPNSWNWENILVP